MGGDLRAPSESLRAPMATAVQVSDEIYLLSTLCDANVKIRDALMDVKQLEQVNEDGLEQWRPVLKAAFPLPAETLAQVFEALGLPVPELPRSEYGQDRMIAELVETEPRLRAVHVHKTRTRYRFAGCSAELTEVAAEGLTVTTLAVECEDPAAAIAAVRTLGLENAANQSYPRGLKSLIGMTGDESTPRAGPRYAVIDVGTNSVKFHVAERDRLGHWRRVSDRAEVTRLEDGLQESGAISPAAQTRTVATIQGMVEEARQAGAGEVVAVGTMGMRNARNADAFIAAVRAACGVTIEVISGDEEARLAYLAVQEALGIPGGVAVVFDTGGGSTQVTIGQSGEIRERFSINLGAARLTEQFGLSGPVSGETLAASRAAIAGELGRLDGVERPDALVGMGGAVPNLAAVSLAMTHYDPDRIQGASLTRAEAERQIAWYADRDADARRSMPGLQPGRAEVILAGALIVLSLLDKLGQHRLAVSDRGLRHGVLIDRFSA